jgi:hypothetical protein
MASFGLTLSPAPWLALLALAALHPANAMAHGEPPRAKAASQTVTAAPIYLPYYDERSWSLVRGSIISTVCNGPPPRTAQFVHLVLSLLEAI